MKKFKRNSFDGSVTASTEGVEFRSMRLKGWCLGQFWVSVSCWRYVGARYKQTESWFFIVPTLPMNTVYHLQAHPPKPSTR